MRERERERERERDACVEKRPACVRARENAPCEPVSSKAVKSVASYPRCTTYTVLMCSAYPPVSRGTHILRRLLEGSGMKRNSNGATSMVWRLPR